MNTKKLFIDLSIRRGIIQLFCAAGLNIVEVIDPADADLYVVNAMSELPPILDRRTTYVIVSDTPQGHLPDNVVAMKITGNITSLLRMLVTGIAGISKESLGEEPDMLVSRGKETLLIIENSVEKRTELMEILQYQSLQTYGWVICTLRQAQKYMAQATDTSLTFIGCDWDKKLDRLAFRNLRQQLATA